MTKFSKIAPKSFFKGSKGDIVDETATSSVNQGMKMNIRKSELTPLKDIMADLLAGGLSFNPDDAKIWEVWNEVVGPDIAENASPVQIKDGVLKVAVANALWLQDLLYDETSIRANLNECLGREVVTRISFNVGPK